MTERLLEAHAEELRVRIASLGAGLVEEDSDDVLAEAHRLRGSALVLGLDGLAVAVAAYEAALATPRDTDGARRAATLAARELERALEPDALRSLRHDLRNDLNIVLMGSKLLEADLESPDQRDLAESIASAAERMAGRLVDLRSDTVGVRISRADNAAALSVLLVEDDALVAGVVARMLAAAGARVATAAGLAEARLALAASEYDAAVIDLRLADGSGADLVPELSERGIRTVILTGDGQTDVPGAEHVLTKPVDSAVLVAAVTGGMPPG
jgi:CheY-like chemotaxis protein/HPt (histidine-containing phosphotransfer) domain-containing protein